jgi:hypothetical protein
MLPLLLFILERQMHSLLPAASLRPGPQCIA